MKKALPDLNEVFVFERQGKLTRWDIYAEELVEAVNSGPTGHPQVDLVYRKLYQWMRRYLDEGVTDEFLNDLNAAIRKVLYRKYILPLDFSPPEAGYPKNGYVADHNMVLEPEVYAADEFSKFLTSGQLLRLRSCQLDECENFFLGPPQAKWCSKTCGSKFRVREKRKRDLL